MKGDICPDCAKRYNRHGKGWGGFARSKMSLMADESGVIHVVATHSEGKKPVIISECCKFTKKVRLGTEKRS